MPGLNRRGSQGIGPMTGRRMGRCIPENKGKTDEEISQIRASSLEAGQEMGWGFGRRRGFGKGLGRGMGMRFRGNA